MRRATLVAALVTGAAALAAALGASAAEQTAQVSIEYGDYAPTRVDVVTGDTVAWSNDSPRNHTVTDDGDGYDSGTLVPTDRFQRRFASAGSFPYHCRLHPSIRGEVDVHQLLLDPQPVPAQAGAPFPIGGRSALAPGTNVSIESDDGSGFRPVAVAAVGQDGRFSASVTPADTASYRAVARGEVSPPVQVLVLNRSVALSVRRGRRTTVVTVSVAPASPGSTVVLQVYLRERFGWWPVGQATVGKASLARFVLRLSRPASARARLTLPDGATPLATSPTIRVGRTVRGRP
jgi:plastocyanin